MCIVLLLLATPTHAAITAKITYQTHAAFLAAQNPAPGLLVIRRSPASNDQDNAVGIAWPTFTGNVTNQVVNLGSTAGWYSAVYNHANASQAMNCTTNPISFSQFQYLADGDTINITITCTAPPTPPTLSGVSSSSGPAVGGSSVTLTGTNLSGATAVRFGSTAATAYTVNSATTITATTPAHAAGAVNVTVTTPDGTATLTNGYTYKAPLSVSTSAINVACNGQSTGWAKAIPAGGAPGYVYSWTNGASTQTIPSLIADSYTVTVRDADNATVSATVTITQPSAITANPSFTNPTSGASGSASVSPSGGAGAYTYLWSSSAASQTTATATGLGAGTHIVTITDANACTKQQSFTLIAPATAPGAPTIGSATAGNGQASVAFTASASTGGAAITSYTATASPGSKTGSCTASPCTVIGLTNGTAYSFTVTATNSVGTGAASAASNSVTPKAAQTITFANPGAQSFGTAPALSASASSGLTPTFMSSTTGVCTITSSGALTFVAAGSCTINADQAGDGVYLPAVQVSQAFTVSAVVPGAPTIGSATVGSAQAAVAFIAPVSNGGAAISSYTVTSSPDGRTGSCTGSPCTVTGLTNGTAYNFTVAATNSAGTGAASAASNSVTPKAGQTITFTYPGAQNFGSTPTLAATASSGLTPTFTSATTGVCSITSGGALTFVGAGTCMINADQTGNSVYLPAVQVSQAFTVSAVVPGAPTIGTATAGDTQAAVTFSTPSSNGGAAITGYTVTASPGGATGTGAASPIVVTGLSNGQAYTFTVAATNSAGTGVASDASNSVTFKASQTITFNNPGAQNFGTTPTLPATASSGLTPTFTSATTGACTITSGGTLTFVGAGTCTIHADQGGDGTYLPATQISQSFTVKAVVPHAPTTVIATAGDAQASVAFTAPTFSGGAAITGYTVTASPGGATGTGAASPILVTGLGNGQAYTFTVAATNSVGTGAASAPSSSVTPAGLPITGVCGSANAVAASAAPSASLCSAGAPSSVTGAATAFAWDCAGSYGGTTAQCSAPRQYQVTASAGANGSITPAGVQLVAYNATPSFTLTPAALYRIDSVSGCAGTLVGSTYTTGAVAAHCSVSASFVLIAHAITATAQPSAGGSITCTPSTVGEGANAACTAMANAGYMFQKWTGACAGQAAACSLTNVTAPQDSAALFVQEATGLVVPEGVKQGAGLALALQPSADNWVTQSASTATVASTGTSGPSGLQLPHGLVKLTLVTGTAGSSATVVLTYPQVLPAGTKYYKFGKTAANPTDHWYEFSGAVISGNTITLTLTDGGDGDNDLTANSVIDDPGGPAVVTAPPPPPPPPPPPSLVQLQVTISGAGTVQRSLAGSVVGTPGSSTTVEYLEGQSVTLTPQPAPGARFSGWMGACSGLLPCQLTLRSDQAVQATFTPLASCRSNVFSDYEERLLDTYLAYYGRPADVAGLAYWVAQLAGKGGRLDTIVDAFGNSQEFQTRFGQLTQQQLIANLYQQMYGREPDEAGAAFFLSQLAAGRSSLAAIALHIFDGRLGSDRSVVENRKKVVRHFVTRFEELGSAAPALHDGHVLSRLVVGVGADEASAIAGCARVDQLLDAALGR